MSETLLLVVYALAAGRVTGLITADQLTAKARAWAVRRLDAPVNSTGHFHGWRAYATYLVTCAWCVSIYVGAVAAVVWYTLGDNPVLLVAAVGLAISQVTGVLSDLGRG